MRNDKSMKILRRIGQVAAFPFVLLITILLGLTLSACIKTLGEESEDLGSSAVFPENFLPSDEKRWRLKNRHR